MAPMMESSITDTDAVSLLQAELGTTCGLVCPWVWLAGGIVRVVSDGGSGDSGVIGAANSTRSSTAIHQ